MFVNMNKEEKMYCEINRGSICQVQKVEKLYLATNQYQYETDIEVGQKVVIREDSYYSSWDNFSKEYVQSNDTYVTTYCRKIGVFEYRDEDFSDRDFRDTEYIITRIVDIDDDVYVEKVLSDLRCQKENAKISSFDRTPIFARESYLSSLEELEELEEEI